MLYLIKMIISMDYEKPLLIEKQEGMEVVDYPSQNAIEISSLSPLVNETITDTGSIMLKQRILNPSTSVQEIKEKQEALMELRSNDKLRGRIEDTLNSIKEYEEDSCKFLHCWSSNDEYYDTQSSIRTLMVELPKWSKEIPEPESKYLKFLKGKIDSLDKSPIQKLAIGPIFSHLFKNEVYGFKELSKKGPLVYPIPFHKSKVVPSAIRFLMPSITSFSIDPYSPWALSGLCIGLIWSTGGIPIGENWDDNNIIYPMKKRFISEGEDSFKAIGRLDELLAYDKFGQTLQKSTLPDIYENEQHEFYAEGLINAIQSLNNPNYIPNDINLNNGQRLTFLTGPNSGGKTSLGKAIAQAQILAQMGCYIPADNAKMSIADKIYYLVGKNDNLNDEEGGLGTQLKETKKILFNSSPKSLVIIDDLIEGTTFDEKTKLTKDQLCGFIHKRPNTIYVSHHHELAKEFYNQGVGNFLQVEFNGEKPTYKIISGISTNSHSDLVSKRVGFDADSIKQHLVEKGYLKPEFDLRDLSKYSGKISNN